MVIYTREEKVLIIPEGEGCGCQGGGGRPSKNCEREKREAYESGYTAGLHADCGEAIDEAYNSGYTAGLEACSGSTDCSSAITEAYQSGITEGMAEQKALLSSTAITTNGIYTNENGWNSVNVNVPRFMPAEEKTLSLVEHSTGPWEVVASYPIGMSKVTVEDNGYGQGKYDEGYADGIADCSGSTDCSSAITEAYQSGYTAGLADCSGSSCTLEEGELDISDFWDGGPTVVYPSTADGFSQFTVEDTNGSYAYKHYMDGYNDGLAQCSGSTDCSSAVTEAYQSGYTEGYNDALYEKCDLETTLIVVPSGSTGIMNDITPTEAAGFGSVSVNATEYGEWKYQSGYTEGYQSGYTQGQADCDCTETYQIGYNDGYEDGRESVTSGCPMQEKSISLSSIEESVSPDYGYAGLSEVHINAQSFYNTAYNDGYAAGLEDCSGSTDCSSAITEAYQSGYTEGYTDGQASVHCPTNVQSTAQKVMTQQVETFYPDAGYDGMGSVVVDGSGLWNSAYTEGHTSGYTEGYNEAITANCGSAITEAYESGVTEGQGSIFSVKVRWFSENGGWNWEVNNHPPLFIVDESGVSHTLNYQYSQSPDMYRRKGGTETDTPTGSTYYYEYAGYLQDGAKYIQPYQVQIPMLNDNLWNNNISGLSVEINGEVIHNWQTGPYGDVYDDWQFGSGAWRFTPLATVVSDTYYDATHKMVTFYIQGQVPNNN